MSAQCNISVPYRLDSDGAPPLYYIPYEYGSIIGLEKSWSGYDKEPFYLAVSDYGKYWSLSICGAAFYLFVAFTLQSVMKSRNAFELKWSLVVWNTIIALYSLIGAIRTGEEFMFVLRTRSFLDSISYTVDPQQPAAFWGLFFTVSKIFELFDTLFVVLRKSKLRFLHWYHHAVVLVVVWHSATEMPAVGRYFIFMNFAVHAVMYSYFAIRSAGIRLPRLVSMVVTTLEATQMFAAVLLSCIVLYFKLQGRVMQQSYENLAICFAIYISFAVLYMILFKKSYLSEQNVKKSQ